MLDPAVTANLPLSVIAALADSDHRAQCAEVALERERERAVELRDEVTLLRAIVGEMQTLATELQERAGDVALVAQRGGTIVRSIADYDALYGPRPVVAHAG